MFDSLKPVVFALAILFFPMGCEPSVSSIADINDQSDLANYATRSSDWEVRKAAVAKLTDQAALANIVLADESSEVRAAAIDALTGQSYLAYVALRVSNETDRAAADRKITDQVVLSNYIQQLGDPRMIQSILDNRLTSQTLIAWVAINAPSESLRNAAAKKVTSYEIFEEVAAASPSRWAPQKYSPTVVRENASQ